MKMRLHGKQGLRPHRLAQRGTAPGRRRSHRPSMASIQCVGCLGKGVIRPGRRPALGSDVPVRRCDSASTDGHGGKIPPLAQEEPACPPCHVEGAARARARKATGRYSYPGGQGAPRGVSCFFCGLRQTANASLVVGSRAGQRVCFGGVAVCVL